MHVKLRFLLGDDMVATQHVTKFAVFTARINGNFGCFMMMFVAGSAGNRGTCPIIVLLALLQLPQTYSSPSFKKPVVLVCFCINNNKCTKPTQRPTPISHPTHSLSSVSWVATAWPYRERGGITTWKSLASITPVWWSFQMEVPPQLLHNFCFKPCQRNTFKILFKGEITWMVVLDYLCIFSFKLELRILKNRIRWAWYYLKAERKKGRWRKTFIGKHPC